MNQRTVLITGANRGLGAAFVEPFLSRGYSVFAGARNPATSSELKKLPRAHEDRLHVVSLDVSSDSSVKSAADVVARKTDQLDILINNAGRYGKEGAQLKNLDIADVLKTFDVNTVGCLRTTLAFLPLLRKGAEKKIVHITSQLGSIADNRSGGSYGYRLSKAALNMLGKNLAIDLAAEGITCVLLHPGWVKTDMGGPNAPLDIETSVAGMINVIVALTKDQSGSFLGYGGEVLPY